MSKIAQTSPLTDEQIVSGLNKALEDEIKDLSRSSSSGAIPNTQDIRPGAERVLPDRGLPRRAPAAPHKFGLIARSIVASVRVFAGSLMLLIWFFIIGPIWLAVLLRTIASYAIATVISVFAGREPPNAQRLDAVSTLWTSGFHKLTLTITMNSPESIPHLPIDIHMAFRETVLAILLYGGVYSWAWMLAWLKSLVF